MFTIEERTLVNRGSKPGTLVTMHLEQVRDYLKVLAEKQQPTDLERSLDQLHVSFSGQRMTARLLSPQGLGAEELLISTLGAQHLAQQVLPPRFFAGLRSLAHMDEQGEKLATVTWAKFASRQDKPRMLRTVNIRTDTGAQRMIRSVHSQDYGAYSNLEFVQDLLDNAGSLTARPVIDLRVTDGAMRLRFAADEIELHKPVRMFEAWNSEVGMRRVGLRGGMWKLVCTNGMGNWDGKSEYNWIHRGDADRIRRGVQSAIENIATSAAGVVAAYQRAMDVAIDDAYLWLERELGIFQFTQDRIDKAKQALTDPTTTPGFTLASAVDSVTLIAQQEPDLFMQEQMEQVASKMLDRNLVLARGQGNRLGLA